MNLNKTDKTSDHSALDLGSINESSSLTGNDNNTVSNKTVTKNGAQYQQLGQTAPGPRTLMRCSFRQGFDATVRTSRIIAAAMFGAGCASGICSKMMNESSVNPNEPVFLGVGTLMYIASLAPALTHPTDQAKKFLIQAGKDAVVPALTAFSIYFLQAHQKI